VSRSHVGLALLVAAGGSSCSTPPRPAASTVENQPEAARCAPAPPRSGLVIDDGQSPAVRAVPLDLDGDGPDDLAVTTDQHCSVQPGNCHRALYVDQGCSAVGEVFGEVVVEATAHAGLADLVVHTTGSCGRVASDDHYVRYQFDGVRYVAAATRFCLELHDGRLRAASPAVTIERRDLDESAGRACGPWTTVRSDHELDRPPRACDAPELLVIP
jgi:hypothetical protein